ncbi:hypothetical protein H7849_14850 [Alloacidobacterium dinghuense]|uniref:Uncharacterized protein n=1 Tax=Alloacidobacterium dinghuense TaxID=2763107 RepID=A0A7G8BD12_9BACT|nr:hypothetical protein [Alloacidobacterium dinghuense]QNI30432.1 hypothetical protein H7849_14850 [Alloacidobacterium dinghuense]
MYPLENFARDLYRAMRQLIRSREFASMAILTLAFGISANFAIFSIVKAVLLRPLPYRHPERLSWQKTSPIATQAHTSTPIANSMLAATEPQL